MTKFLRLPDVMERTGLSRSSVYELIAAGAFPKPVKLGPRAVGVPETEYEAWATERLREREAA
jgi:prophage regulatory protein